MTRTVGRLTARKVETLRVDGLYGDGGGLYLQIRDQSKTWVFRFRDGSKVRIKGKGTRLRDMGLGPLHTLSLADARSRATECRKQILGGLDPIAAREAARAQARLEAARAITFKDCAEKFIATHQPAWRNAKHAQQWRSTLETYAYPVLGSLRVQGIDTGLVLQVLESIWTEKPETASRVRGRIEAILDWATVREHRHGANPARWRGHLDKSLPARRKVREVEHHPALPYPDIGEFMALLRARKGVAARALEFAILTVGRTCEILKATWAEIDMTRAIWTIAGTGIKAHDHVVPLCAPAVALLRELEKTKDGPFMFPGGKRGKPLSDMGMETVLRRMERDDITVHGFRSTFRDWAAEQTSFPREVVEMALSHAVGSQVERAYLRSNLLPKRRRLMDAWGGYCGSGLRKGDNVVALRSTANP